MPIRNSETVESHVGFLPRLLDDPTPTHGPMFVRLAGGSQLLLLVGCTDNHPAQRQREGPGFRRHTHRRLRGATRHLHGVPTIPVKRAASHAVVKCRVIVGCTNDIELDLLSGSKGPLVIIVKLIDGAKRDWASARHCNASG